MKFYLFIFYKNSCFSLEKNKKKVTIMSCQTAVSIISYNMLEMWIMTTSSPISFFSVFAYLMRFTLSFAFCGREKLKAHYSRLIYVHLSTLQTCRSSDPISKFSIIKGKYFLIFGSMNLFG